MTAVLLPWGPIFLGTEAGFTPQKLNDADNAIALQIAIPKSGTITKIGFQCEGIVGDPPAYNCALTTVNVASGNPEQAAYGGSSIDTHDFLGLGWVWLTLGTPATATLGEFAAIHIWPQAASPPDAANYATFHYNGIGNYAQMPRSSYYTALWMPGGGINKFAIQYSTGEVYGIPTSTCLAWNAYDAADSPDEAGAKFTLPADMVCFGARFEMWACYSTAPFQIKLYDAGDSLLQSFTIANEDLIYAGTMDFVDVFWADQILTAEAIYRLTLLATHATRTIQPICQVLESEASRINNIMIPEASQWQGTERTDGGAWTDRSTYVPWLGLWINDITITGGNGGAGELSSVFMM